MEQENLPQHIAIIMDGNRRWAKERGFSYLPVHNDEELTSAMAVFTQSAPHNQPMLMEVFTDASEDVRLLKEYYHQLKK